MWYLLTKYDKTFTCKIISYIFKVKICKINFPNIIFATVRRGVCGYLLIPPILLSVESIKSEIS